METMASAIADWSPAPSCRPLSCRADAAIASRPPHTVFDRYHCLKSSMIFSLGSMLKCDQRHRRNTERHPLPHLSYAYLELRLLLAKIRQLVGIGVLPACPGNIDLP